MNAPHEGLIETASRLFAEQPREGGLSARLWGMLEDANLTLVSVPERYGGAGGALKDAAAILRLAGRYAVPAPLTETGWLAGPWQPPVCRSPTVRSPLRPCIPVSASNSSGEQEAGSYLGAPSVCPGRIRPRVSWSSGTPRRRPL